ncbi:MAG: ompA-like transrane domain protein [Ramlibacter sp.]|nr:ompA-like transrane domain protein [Ramlibacter sp.]
MKFHKLAIPALIAMAATAASAEGAYVLGQVTRSTASLDGSSFDNQLTATGASSLSSSSGSNSNQWRLQGGYRFSPSLSVEGGYIDFGNAGYQASYGGGTANGNVKAAGLDAAVLYSVPLNAKVSVFAKGGIVAARVKSSLTASAPGSSNDDSATVVRPLIGFGSEVALTQKVSLRLDYDHVSGLGTSSSGRMNVDMVSVGLGYKF